MTSRRSAGIVCVVVALLAACSDESSSSGTTTTSTSTTVAPTTTVPPTTTEATTTTIETTTTAATTTTIPVVEGLELSGAGLGDALFGADAEGVIDYVESIIGAPSNDSGWIDPLSLGAACPGTEVRFVEWTDLVLFFSNDSPVAAGVRHFASYHYGPPFGENLVPFGLATAADVSVGDTVATLVGVYPTASVFADDGLGASFRLDDETYGFLTGTTDADTITSIGAGIGCGE